MNINDLSNKHLLDTDNFSNFTNKMSFKSGVNSYLKDVKEGEQFSNFSMDTANKDANAMKAAADSEVATAKYYYDKGVDLGKNIGQGDANPKSPSEFAGKLQRVYDRYNGGVMWQYSGGYPNDLCTRFRWITTEYIPKGDRQGARDTLATMQGNYDAIKTATEDVTKAYNDAYNYATNKKNWTARVVGDLASGGMSEVTRLISPDFARQIDQKLEEHIEDIDKSWLGWLLNPIEPIARQGFLIMTKANFLDIAKLMDYHHQQALKGDSTGKKYWYDLTDKWTNKWGGDIDALMSAINTGRQQNKKSINEFGKGLATGGLEPYIRKALEHSGTIPKEAITNFDGKYSNFNSEKEEYSNDGGSTSGGTAMAVIGGIGKVAAAASSIFGLYKLVSPNKPSGSGSGGSGGGTGGGTTPPPKDTPTSYTWVYYLAGGLVGVVILMIVIKKAVKK